MDYYIVRSPIASPLDFANEVNRWLRKGYELYGAPFCSQVYLHQAVIKREDTPND